ncbi:MAG: type II secretion system protein [Gammaproteobacteria bacterium]|nr:type II secretion system protein [Gammaproteobacteria bacterium]
MNKQTGFTLIELVMVIVIIGILAAMAVPRFVDMQGEAETAAQEGTLAAVRTAYATATAQANGYPTVTQIAANVQTGSGGTATAAATGVQVVINTTTYTVLTYTDATCLTPTAAVGNAVRCVGNIN